MKKLSILLIGLMLVAGIAFADFGDVEVSGSASVTWGIDLDTGATGFENAGTPSVSITLIDEASAEATGDDGLYGYIQVDEYSLSIDDGAITSALGTVSASIFVDPAEIVIYTAPGMSWGNAATIEATDVDVAPALASDSGNVIGGITIIVPVDPVTPSIYLVSDGGKTNVDNDYAAGLDVELAIDPVTVDLGAFYGWFSPAGTWGATVGVELVVDPATVNVGFDIVDGGSWDVGAGVVVDLSEANDDDETANVAVDVYYATNNLDVSLGFTEPEAGGLADMLYAGLTVDLLNLTSGTVGWAVDLSGGYDTGDVDPYFGFYIDSADMMTANAGVALKAGLTGIDNTTITLDYTSGDLGAATAVLGQITVTAEVAF